MNSVWVTIIVLILGICIILLLISLVILVITIIITIIKGICNKSWCLINTNVSVSLDGGSTYTSNSSNINNRKIIHLKYEVSARIDSVLPPSVLYKIPFYIKIPKQCMDVTLIECSENCNRNAGEKLSTKKEENEFTVYANRKKTGKVKIILKCERNSVDKLFAFKLVFKDKQLKRYSKAIVF